MTNPDATTDPGSVALTPTSTVIAQQPIGDNPSDEQIIGVLRDRLRGNGAWNGQGLLMFLATTSRKDPERVWMEPLKALAERVVYANEDGEPMPALSDDEMAQVRDLIAYSDAFHTALAAGQAAEAQQSTEPPPTVQ
jgi:hypothetical protein